MSTSRRGVFVSGGFGGYFIHLFMSSLCSLVHVFINSQSQPSLSECSVSGVFADVRAPRWFVLFYYCHVLSHARCLLFAYYMSSARMLACPFLCVYTCILSIYLSDRLDCRGAFYSATVIGLILSVLASAFMHISVSPSRRWCVYLANRNLIYRFHSVVMYWASRVIPPTTTLAAITHMNISTTIHVYMLALVWPGQFAYTH
jgi:hypothetical protein